MKNFKNLSIFLIFKPKYSLFYSRLETNIVTNKQEIPPRKQGAHFLGARAQIQDSWVFSSSV
jgi:hypothetical protein